MAEIRTQNQRSVRDVVKSEKASLNVFPCADGRLHKDSNVPVWFFICGNVRGMVAKNAHDTVKAGQWDSLQCVEIADANGNWIPTICKSSSLSAVATLSF